MRITRPLTAALILCSACSSAPAPGKASRARAGNASFRLAPTELVALEAAASTNAEAALRVGNYYTFYRWDEQCARHFFQLGADLGHLAAYHKLGHLLVYGEDSDLSAARLCLEKGLAIASSRRDSRWLPVLASQLQELRRVQEEGW